MTTETPYTICGRSFRLRTELGPVSTAWINRHLDELTELDAMPASTSEEQRMKGMRIVELFFPTEEQCLASMRMMLDGDHTGIDWAYGVGLETMVLVLRDWVALHRPKARAIATEKNPARKATRARAKK